VTSVSRRERQQAAEVLYALGAAVVRLAPREISLTAVSVLATLDRTGPRRVTDLAAVQGVSQPSMTSLVSGLERAGYVERRSDPSDRRASLVALTEAGSAKLRDRRTAGRESTAALIDELTPEEAASLVAALPALRRLLEVDAESREGS
jgi:DNA-binding MarR family transcriptional regulator